MYAFVVYLFLRDGKYKNFCAKKRAQRNAPKTAKKMNMCKNLLHTLKNPQRLRRPQRRRTANGSPANRNWTRYTSGRAVGANAAPKLICTYKWCWQRVDNIQSNNGTSTIGEQTKKKRRQRKKKNLKLFAYTKKLEQKVFIRPAQRAASR